MCCLTLAQFGILTLEHDINAPGIGSLALSSVLDENASPLFVPQCSLFVPFSLSFEGPFAQIDVGSHVLICHLRAPMCLEVAAFPVGTEFRSEKELRSTLEKRKHNAVGEFSMTKHALFLYLDSFVAFRLPEPLSHLRVSLCNVSAHFRHPQLPWFQDFMVCFNSSVHAMLCVAPAYVAGRVR